MIDYSTYLPPDWLTFYACMLILVLVSKAARSESRALLMAVCSIIYSPSPYALMPVIAVVLIAKVFDMYSKG